MDNLTTHCIFEWELKKNDINSFGFLSKNPQTTGIFQFFLSQIPCIFIFEWNAEELFSKYHAIKNENSL